MELGRLIQVAYLVVILVAVGWGKELLLPNSSDSDQLFVSARYVSPGTLEVSLRSSQNGPSGDQCLPYPKAIATLRDRYRRCARMRARILEPADG